MCLVNLCVVHECIRFYVGPMCRCGLFWQAPILGPESRAVIKVYYVTARGSLRKLNQKATGLTCN